MVETITILAVAAASSSLVKILSDAVSTWIKRKKSRNVEIQRPDGTRVTINFDPSQEESVRTFLTEIGKESSTKERSPELGGRK